MDALRVASQVESQAASQALGGESIYAHAGCWMGWQRTRRRREARRVRVPVECVGVPRGAGRASGAHSCNPAQAGGGKAAK